MKIIKNLKVKVVPAIVLLGAKSRVYADALTDRLNDLQTSSDAPTFVDNLYRFAMPIAVLSLVLLGLYAGIVMLTSEGNPEKLNEAREILTNAVIGFVMIALAVALLRLLSNVLGLSF